MTLEELLSLARTPLPVPQISAERLAQLRASGAATGAGLAGLLPSLPQQLPVAPEWMRRYVVERGLVPGAGAAPRVPLSAMQSYPAMTPYGAPVRQ